MDIVTYALLNKKIAQGGGGGKLLEEVVGCKSTFNQVIPSSTNIKGPIDSINFDTTVSDETLKDIWINLINRRITQICTVVAGDLEAEDYTYVSNLYVYPAALFGGESADPNIPITEDDFVLLFVQEAPNDDFIPIYSTAAFTGQLLPMSFTKGWQNLDNNGSYKLKQDSQVLLADFAPVPDETILDKVNWISWSFGSKDEYKLYQFTDGKVDLNKEVKVPIDLKLKTVNKESVFGEGDINIEYSPVLKYNFTGVSGNFDWVSPEELTIAEMFKKNTGIIIDTSVSPNQAYNWSTINWKEGYFFEYALFINYEKVNIPTGGEYSPIHKIKVNVIKISIDYDSATYRWSKTENIILDSSLLPQATATQLGGVKAKVKTDADTQEIHIDTTSGELFTKAIGESPYFNPNKVSLFEFTTDSTNNKFALEGDNLAVDWGDGKREVINGWVEHIYEPNLDIMLVVKGKIKDLTVNLNLTYLSLGENELSFMEDYFALCTKLTEVGRLNLDNTVYLARLFRQCSNLKIVPPIYAPKALSIEGMFNQCVSLISIPSITAPLIKDLSNSFSYCSSLYEIPYFNAQNISLPKLTGCSNIKEINLYNINTNLDISDCTNMQRPALVKLLYNLQQVSSPKTLTLGETLFNRLTPEDQKIATDKGWILA